MPENINEPTILHWELKGLPNQTERSPMVERLSFAISSNAPGFKKEGDLLEGLHKIVIERIIALRRKIEKEYPEYAEEHAARIDLMFNLVFNYLQLDPETLRFHDTQVDMRDPHAAEKNRKNYEKYGISETEKETSARIGHALAHHFIEASWLLAQDATPEERVNDEKLVDLTYSLYQNTWTIMRLLNEKVSTYLPAYWGGIRNEVAVVRTLVDDGWSVYLPDYAQDMVGEDESEVLQMDVRKGIDIICVSPESKSEEGSEEERVVFLVDIKGRRQPAEVTINEAYRKSVDLRNTHPCLRNVLNYIAYYEKLLKNGEDIDSLKIVQTKLFIPTEGKNFQPADYTLQRTYEGKKKALGKFGLLFPEHKIAIIDSLNRLSRDDSLEKRILR